MKSLQVAARFAAFVWYTNNREAPRDVVRQEATKFAQENWRAFLPAANKGLGRLLLRIAKQPASRREPISPRAGRPPQRGLAVAS